MFRTTLLLIASLVPFAVHAQDCSLPLQRQQASHAALYASHPQSFAANVPSVFGNFALQQGKDGGGPNRFITIQQLQMPGVDGVCCREEPQWLSIPDPKHKGQFIWSTKEIDATRQRAVQAGNKAWTLLLKSGQKDPVLSEASLSFYEQAFKFLGGKYDSDPLLVAVHITGATPEGVSEEPHWKPMPANAIAAEKRMIDAVVAAFPDKMKILTISPMDPKAMRQIMAYAQSKAPGQILVKNNSLKAATSLSAAQSTLLVEAGKAGMEIGWEPACSQVNDPSRFGSGGWSKASSIMKSIMQQAGRNQRFLEIYPPDLKFANTLR